MTNVIETSKNDLTTLYKRGSVAANELYGELSQSASKAYRYLSRHVTVLSKDLYARADSVITKEYSSQTMIMLFALPYIGNIFWALKEIDYAKKMNQAENPSDKVRIIELKNELIKCHMTALAIKAVFYVAMGFLFPAITAVSLLMLGAQFLRLSVNEEGLNKYNGSQKEHELALVF